jgi:predicted GNAT family acetyltransferase
VIARPAVDGVVRALAAAIRDEDLALPSLRGAEPEAGAFADAWCALAGTRARLNMSQRIYRLTAVRPATGVSGSMREALIDDRDVLLDLLKAFAAETFPDDEEETAGMERRLDLRLASPDPGLFLWEDGGPAVCLVGAGNPTPNGIRIGPVYTPREHRRRGYASALTAAVSALQLARGRRFCFLFTDLANPTSNAIYRRIGYEPVCDASDIRFEPIRA